MLQSQAFAGMLVVVVFVVINKIWVGEMSVEVCARVCMFFES